MDEKTKLEYAKNMLLNHDSKLFDVFSMTFPTATENIKDMYAKLELKDKDILTVTSSGDHIFCAVKEGVKKVDSFDINYFTNYYVALKKAIIQTYDEFKDFENILFYKIISEGYVPKECYEEIRQNLEGKYQKFWDEIIDYADTLSLKLNNMFFKPSSHIYTLVNYLNNKDYTILRDNLSKIPINFIHSDITKLDEQLNSKYDYMFFSNIYDYIGIDTVKDYAKEKLIPYLNDNGEIIYAYMYDLDKNKAEKLSESFYHVPSITNANGIEDCILTLKK